MALVYSHMCFILSCFKTFAVPEWISSKGILAYSHTGHILECASLLLCLGILTRGSLYGFSQAKCALSLLIHEVSIFLGVCCKLVRAENANLKAFSLQLSPSRWSYLQPRVVRTLIQSKRAALYVISQSSQHLPTIKREALKSQGLGKEPTGNKCCIFSLFHAHMVHLRAFLTFDILWLFEIIISNCMLG